MFIIILHSEVQNNIKNEFKISSSTSITWSQQIRNLVELHSLIAFVMRLIYPWFVMPVYIIPKVNIYRRNYRISSDTRLRE